MGSERSNGILVVVRLPDGKRMECHIAGDSLGKVSDVSEYIEMH